MRFLVLSFLLTSCVSIASDFRGMRMSGLQGSGWSFKGDTYCMQPDGKQTDLVTTKVYGQFELSFEWKLAAGGNSGVKYLIQEKTGAVGYEMQLLDDELHPDGKVGPQRRTGSLYDILPAQKKPNFQLEQWNSGRIVFRRDNVEHWINDDLVLRFSRGDRAFLSGFRRSKFQKRGWYLQRDSGRILFQDHGDPVCFRNIDIKPL